MSHCWTSLQKEQGETQGIRKLTLSQKAEIAVVSLQIMEQLVSPETEISSKFSPAAIPDSVALASLCSDLSLQNYEEESLFLGAMVMMVTD